MATRQLPSLLQDDVFLDGVARQVTTDVRKFFSRERLESEAIHDERARLARELHDSVLQTMTALALELHALAILVVEDPKAAQSQLREIECLLMEEQRKLRTWVQELRASPPQATASSSELCAALEELRRRAEAQWKLRVRLDVAHHGNVPRALGDEIHRIAQEGLSNIGRHAHARMALVEVRILFDRVHIALADDGVGFPFAGRFDLAMLTAQRLGPKSIVERVGALRGQLLLTTSPSGSRLEMDLPLHAKPRPRTASGARAA